MPANGKRSAWMIAGGDDAGGDGDGEVVEAAAVDTDDVDESNRGGDSTDPVADRKELRAWYAFDWANSAYATVVVGGYLPLLLQALALEHAGFPDMCPNLITNTTMILQAFPNSTSQFAYLDFVRKGISSCADTEQSYKALLSPTKATHAPAPQQAKKQASK
ncbi:hypothetical protein PTSG_10099 [Salpingoeca rosetta]|uniref:Uncharacterized protein n=1 Tax=Salpingoeca rosetta (strain ATCC 50818 / BSB-021) TaxID=946362 RepID=F2UPH4_SALR5|nr:uncharacterized protein PTSG_10099 [Salpingoeca rosetta]EGD79529.1 hypothetical protein PTSG_10099 [Salpingoeca rosetta]|eukprot:XP_004989010.1 hypothetical protein PTSG_10099 [Salpingoeca rosetta]